METKMTDKQINDFMEKYSKNVTYDFSNYYSLRSMPFRAYKSKYGELPKDANKTKSTIYIFQNLATGKVLTKLPEGAISVKTKCFFSKYVEEIDCVAITFFGIDGEIAMPEFTYFINKEKRIFVYTNKSKNSKGKLEFFPINHASTTTYLCYLCQKSYALEEIGKMFTESFDKMFEIAFLGGNKYTFIRDSISLQQFLMTHEVKKRTGPKQEKINKLCEIKLNDVKLRPINQDYYKDSYYRYGLGQKNKTVVISRVDEETVCLRWFIYDFVNKRHLETSRMFITKTENLFCRKNSYGEYVYITGKLASNNFKTEKIKLEKKNVLVGTKLEYFETAMNEVPGDKKSVLLWLFCYYPIAEKLWKIDDLKFLPKSYINESYWGKFEDTLRSRLGEIDLKNKNVYKALGINKHQASRAHDSARYNIIHAIKNILSVNDLSSIDNTTFDTIFDFLKKANYYGADDMLSMLVNNYSVQAAVRVCKDFFDYNVLENEKGAVYSFQVYNTLNMYRDYLHMITVINDKENFRPYFKSIDDITKMHDAITIIFNLKADRIKQDAFDNRLKTWKKWEYSDNDTFVSIAPTKPNELAFEGLTLNHCVKSYIDRVANGTTNIMFIRKKGHEDTPFFTVEISNTGNIEQVHGNCNRNANTEPELEKYIEEWSKAKKLKVNHYNKVR